MEKNDALFGFFRQAGAAIRKEKLHQVNGGGTIVIETEYDAGLCHDPDGTEMMSDCLPDEQVIEFNC